MKYWSQVGVTTFDSVNPCPLLVTVITIRFSSGKAVCVRVCVSLSLWAWGGGGVCVRA